MEQKSSIFFDFKDCDLGYPDQIVLSGFSWSVYRGEKWAVVGPNGVGKTTLIKTLLGFVPVRAGQLSYYNPIGQVVADRPSVGYLPQISQLDRSFPIRVWEVVDSGISKQLAKGYRQGMIAEALSLVEMVDRADIPIGKLSGGQLQRVLLARALVSKPDLLVLDEPMSFLDGSYKEKFDKLLSQAVHTGCTVVMITHELDYTSMERWQTLSLKNSGE